MKSLKIVPGSVVAPRGFVAGAVFCDLKRLGTGKGSNKGRKRDLALIVSECPATVAGLFTTNQVAAAPVRLCLERVGAGQAQVIVANSGNANACTGRPGLRDAAETAACAARHLRVRPEHVLVASTGRIGVPLPMRHLRQGIASAARALGNTPDHAARAAEAILTSDTQRKEIALEFRVGGRTVRLGGICKGAGMIQPGMSLDGQRPAAGMGAITRHGPGLHATMLCFLTSDAAIELPALQAALQEAVARSFNRITVDGDMSTNDTVLLLANGMAGNTPVVRDPPEARRQKMARPTPFRIFQSALNQACLELAKMIVRDGEGVSRLVTVKVTGARSPGEADAAARAVANSALVKTSWNGGDPNWGRIIDALGYSAATVVEHRVDIGYSPPGSRAVLWSLRRGQPTPATFRQLCAAVAPREFDLHIRLNLGHGEAIVYAADLTEEYVEFNKGDVSDPASLGG